MNEEKRVSEKSKGWWEGRKRRQIGKRTLGHACFAALIILDHFRFLHLHYLYLIHVQYCT